MLPSLTNPDSAKGGKALKVTPTGAHGGYHVTFSKALSEPGTYTFMADIYMPNGNKIDPWIRFETKDADGNGKRPELLGRRKAGQGNRRLVHLGGNHDSFRRPDDYRLFGS